MRVRSLTLAVALVLTATPADAEPLDPLALAQTVTTDTVRVIASIDGPDAGTFLPLCESSDTEPEPNSTIVGTITGDCFSPHSGPICEYLVVSANPHTDPPTVAAGPDPTCIEQAREDVEDLLDKSPVSVPLLFQT